MKINEIFEKCSKIVMSKREDYTTNPEIDNHENFKRSAEIASWFKHDRDKAYAVLIGTKLARLGSLLSKDSKPNNESIEDTFVDLINYCALWMERIGENKLPEITISGLITDHEFRPQIESGSSYCLLCDRHKSVHMKSTI